MSAVDTGREAALKLCEQASRHCNYLYATGNDDNSAEVIKPLLAMVHALLARAETAETAEWAAKRAALEKLAECDAARREVGQMREALDRIGNPKMQEVLVFNLDLCRALLDGCRAEARAALGAAAEKQG